MDDPALWQLLWEIELGPWGAAGIVLLMMLESSPIVGLFIPGVFVMVGLGSLSGTGAIGFTECVLAASLGALLGDSIGYWLGYLGLSERPWGAASRRTRHGRDRARRLFERWGRRAVFLGRFMWFVHPAVPTIAGATGIRPLWFYLGDVPAVLLWVLLYGGIGHWLSGAAERRTLEFFTALGILIGVGFLILFTRYLWRYLHHRKDSP